MPGKGHIIRERYEATAKGYDELYRAEQYKKYFVALRRIPPSGTILDAGCGTGLLIEFLALQGLLHNIKEYHCLDYSRQMLKIAATRAKLYCPHKCLLIEANIMNPPYPDKTFDITYSFTVLDLVDNIQKTIKQLKRITKKQIIITMLKTLPYKDIILKKYQPKIIGTTDKDIILQIPT